MIRTRFTERLGIRHPLIQGPMAKVTGPDLAAAVSEAGGLGTLQAGYDEQPDRLLDEMKAVRSRTGRPFGVGFLNWMLERQETLLDACLQDPPAALLFSFGGGEPMAAALARARDRGIYTIVQVQSTADARAAAEAGADLIVAQGTEAGGHTGGMATLPLLPAVMDAAAPVPVGASGGIADGRGIAAVLAAGAVAAWVGTRYLGTRQAQAHANAKQALLAASGEETLLTRIFDRIQGLDWPEEYPARALPNEFTRRWHGREQELLKNLASVREEFMAAKQQGDYSRAYVYAGQVSGLIRDLPDAGELTERLMAEAEAALEAVSRRLSAGG